MLKFDNGTFVSLAEGANNLGAITLSLGVSPGPVTTTVIPAKTEPLLLKLIAERVSSHTQGIAIVSSSIRRDVDNATARTLVADILSMVQEDA